MWHIKDHKTSNSNEGAQGSLYCITSTQIIKPIHTEKFKIKACINNTSLWLHTSVWSTETSV